MSDFKQLWKFLRDHGYRVSVDRAYTMNDGTTYKTARFAGHGIEGMFGTPGCPSSYLDGRLAADNAKCYNKPSQCPLVIRLPTSRAGREDLLEHLKWLATDEGYENSRSFDFYDHPVLPRDPWTPEEA